jgi:site-specific recombinase XerD
MLSPTCTTASSDAGYGVVASDAVAGGLAGGYDQIQLSASRGASVPVAFEGEGGLWDHYRTWLLLESDCTIDTINVYRRICFRFANPEGGYLAELPRPKRWARASADDLRAFAALPLEDGPRAGQPPSARYRASRISAVKGLYLFAYGAGLIGRDPMALVRSPKIGDDQPRSFDLPELATILQVAADHPDDRMELLFWLGYGDCLRCHAMAALRLEDFHPRPYPGRLRVVRKGRPGRHWVPLHRATRTALDRYLAGRQLTPGSPLVGNLRWPGAPLTAKTVSRLLWTLIRVDADLDHGSAHWLRHSGATRALEAAEGANLEDVRELLDHLDSRTTRRYVAAYQWDVRRRAVDLIPDPRQPTKGS